MPITEVLSRSGVKRTALAKACSLDAATPYSWTVVPPVHVPAVAELTRIPPHELRPDLPSLFPPPKGAVAPAEAA